MYLMTMINPPLVFELLGLKSLFLSIELVLLPLQSCHSHLPMQACQILTTSTKHRPALNKAAIDYTCLSLVYTQPSRGSQFVEGVTENGMYTALSFPVCSPESCDKQMGGNRSP